MTDKFAAAQRIAGLMPRDIRALDDAATLSLLADLATIGYRMYGSKPPEDMAEARKTLSQPRHWAHCLTTANSILRGESTGGHVTPARRSPPKTRTQRLEDVSQRGTCTITASECNEFLRSLPPVPLYG